MSEKDGWVVVVATRDFGTQTSMAIGFYENGKPVRRWGSLIDAPMSKASVIAAMRDLADKLEQDQWEQG